MLCWLLAYLGHIWFWMEKGKQRAAVAPLLSSGVIMMTLYAGALCGMLFPAALLLVLTGLGLFVWMVFRRSKALLHVDLMLFAIGCVGLALRYRNALLVQYDDYSHWGMIVRHLLFANRLPHYGDELIAFQSYPPGAALWIYYVCRFLGGSEGMMLTAQAVLTLAGWLPLLTLAEGGGTVVKRICCTALMIVGLSLFQGTASLMVDNLVAALAVGGLVMVVVQARHDQRRPLLAGIILAVVALVKDSGLFFTILLAGIYAVMSFDRNKAVRWAKGLIWLGIPAAAARIAWSIHIKLAFPAAGLTRHALTIDNMRLMGADKSYQDIFQIGISVAREAASLHNLAVQALCAMGIWAIVLLAARRIRQGVWKIGSEAAAVGGAVVIYAAWLMVLWVMYVFSMELEGARNLVAFERYNSTCALFLLGMFAVCTLSSAEEKAFGTLPAVMLICLPLLIGGWYNGAERLLHETYHVPLRIRMEQAAVQRSLQADERAVVVIDPDEDGMFAGYMARYRLQSLSVEIAHPEDVVWDETDAVYYWLSDLQPETFADVEIIQIP